MGVSDARDALALSLCVGQHRSLGLSSVGNSGDVLSVMPLKCDERGRRSFGPPLLDGRFNDLSSPRNAAESQRGGLRSRLRSVPSGQASKIADSDMRASFGAFQALLKDEWFERKESLLVPSAHEVLNVGMEVNHVFVGLESRVASPPGQDNVHTDSAPGCNSGRVPCVVCRAPAAVTCDVCSWSQLSACGETWIDIRVDAFGGHMHENLAQNTSWMAKCTLRALRQSLPLAPIAFETWCANYVLGSNYSGRVGASLCAAESCRLPLHSSGMCSQIVVSEGTWSSPSLAHVAAPAPRSMVDHRHACCTCHRVMSGQWDNQQCDECIDTECVRNPRLDQADGSGLTTARMMSCTRIDPNDPTAEQMVQELRTKACRGLCWRRPEYNCARCKSFREAMQAKQGPSWSTAPKRAARVFRSVAHARMRAMHMASEVDRSLAKCVHVVIDRSHALVFDAR